MSLADLVARNYHRVYDDEVKTAIPAYMRAHDSIRAEDVLFIKRFTKVATTLLSRHPTTMDGLEEKLYQFLSEGVNKVKAGSNPLLSRNNQLKIAAHMEGHKGSVAAHIFDSTLDISWALKSYKNSEEAIRLDDERGYKGHRLGEMSAIAKRIYHFTGDVAWLEKAHNSQFEAADCFMVEKQVLAAKNLDRAKDTAEQLFFHTNDYSWLVKQYACGSRAADLFGKFSRFNDCASIYERMSDTAFRIFLDSNDETWKDNAIETMTLAKDAFALSSRSRARIGMERAERKLLVYQNHVADLESRTSAPIIAYSDDVAHCGGTKIEVMLHRSNRRNYFGNMKILDVNRDLIEVDIDVVLSENLAKIAVGEVPLTTIRFDAKYRGNTLFMTYLQDNGINVLDVHGTSQVETQDTNGPDNKSFEEHLVDSVQGRILQVYDPKTGKVTFPGMEESYSLNGRMTASTVGKLFDKNSSTVQAWKKSVNPLIRSREGMGIKVDDVLAVYLAGTTSLRTIADENIEQAFGIDSQTMQQRPDGYFSPSNGEMQKIVVYDVFRRTYDQALTRIGDM